MPRKQRPTRSLASYEAKRSFAATPEPGGRRRAAAPSPEQAAHGLYVVQKHAATRLHYDFRLEHAGVLLSWAVPKGPSLDPHDRRLAVQVEDHPVDYADFEGRIPAGNYGAGTVKIWDRGHWVPHGDVDRGLEKGRLDFRLLGGKLAGEWHLVRMEKAARGSSASSKSNWLLFRGAEVGAARAGRKRSAAKADPPKSEVAADLFALATLVPRAPSGDQWVHETKWDGYRLLAGIEDGSARLWSRSGAEWTDRLPEIAEALAGLGAHSAILDGELVAIAGGRSRFQALQTALGEAPGARQRSGLRFVAFDLLTLDGEDLRPLPLVERKRRLALVLANLPPRSRVRSSPHRIGRGNERWEAACARGLEGIISKRADAPYRSGRGREWLKVKCHQRQELVIAGYTLTRTGSRRDLGALLLAVRDGRGFAYAGRVGTGFDASTRRDLLRQLAALAADRSPLAGPVPASRGVHWVRPVLVAEVQFREWTADGRLRQASFVGLRADKAPGAVRRELPVLVPQASQTRPATRQEGADAEVEGVRISHPERLLFPAAKLTKLDLARYFAVVWPYLEPHLRDRPLAFLRCPEGARETCFFQKHWPGELPGVALVDVSAPGEQEAPHARIESVEGLIALAQSGVVELHLWGARARKLERPDRMVFDLDPGPGVPWRHVVEGARLLRSLLAELQLQSFALLSGGKGVHVVVPIVPERQWPEVKAFTAAIAHALAVMSPQRYIDRAAKGEREGRIFVDYLRNGRGATAIAPYSPRARAQGPVATPVSWEELARASPARWTIASVPKRLRARASDPWPDYFRLEQSLSKAALASAGIARAASRRVGPETKTAKGKRTPRSR